MLAVPPSRHTAPFKRTSKRLNGAQAAPAPVLTVHPAQYRHLAAREEKAFIQRLQAKLERDEPALLPRFPPRQRAAIVANICRRARAVGATWESAIGAWGGYMVGIAPNLGRDPAVRAWLASTGATPDETITRLPDLLTEADWARVQAHRSDLPLYLPPEADSHPLASRVAEALPLVLWDLVPPERAQEYAQAAIAAASQLGLGGLDDAPLAVAAWRLLYATSFDDALRGWAGDITEPTRPPAERLAMLRARIMLDHQRWV